MIDDYTWMMKFCVDCIIAMFVFETGMFIRFKQKIQRQTDEIIEKCEQNLKHIKIELDKVNKMLDEYDNNHQ